MTKTHLTPKQVVKIAEIICDEFCITTEEMKQDTRKLEYKEPRQLLSYYCLETFQYNYTVLSRFLNVTSPQVRHYLKVTKNQMETEKGYFDKVKRIELMLLKVIK